MKTIHTKNKLKNLGYLLVFCLLLSLEGVAQCAGGSYGLAPPQGAVKLASKASMDFDNSLSSVVVRNQAVVYGPNTIGTPYTQEAFATAKITSVDKVYLVRYNALTDEMEVKGGEAEILVISKKKSYEINQHSNNVTYRVLEKIDSEKENDLGYYINLEDDDNISLYRKECKKLVQKKRATYGSTASSVTTEFKKMRCEFYIEKAHNGHAIKIPKKKKEFLALFPDKSELISAFIKDNRIKLNKEESLKKLIKYINTI
ncbi:hypothetical protein IMCC3317_32810 [Kordia antarctica]|uniref:DUF4468 domain-containing protein n=1 Tax=Kordia antarctica TaxID=1218801 RepID=A0A7L4ZMF4_9FLAO|nr:hypothetical protein [Kordia antarctica]QHI37898.1 hypothetical protein IMCC3317_32810 [Kordia antarctica]